MPKPGYRQTPEHRAAISAGNRRHDAEHGNVRTIRHLSTLALLTDVQREQYLDLTRRKRFARADVLRMIGREDLI